MMRYWLDVIIMSTYQAGSLFLNYKISLEETNRPTLDLSSSHSNIGYLKLDWSESLEEDNSTITSLIHEKINPQVILGADVVSNL